MISKIYYFLKKRRPAWLLFILALWLVLGYFAFRIHIQEDITKTFPQNSELKQYQDFFKRSPLASKIVVAIGDDGQEADAASLIEAGRGFIRNIDSNAYPLIDTIQYEFGVGGVAPALDFFYQQLPYFLSVKEQDSILNHLDSAAIAAKVNKTLEKLVSPEAFGLKEYLLKDPAGMYPEVLKKLGGLQEGGDFKLIDNHLFTEDGKYVLVFIDPGFPPSESGNNGRLVEQLHHAFDASVAQGHAYKFYAFGGPVVAAKNGEQIRKDTRLAGILVVILVLALLFWYYRKWFVPLLFLVPPLFGITLAVALIYLMQGEISILPLAAGSIVLGIALDYCFHLFTHLKHSGSVTETLKDISWSMVLSSFTTVMAFLSLIFLHSQILTDFGLLASFSLTGTLLFVLFVQPHIVDSLGLLQKMQEREHFIDRLFSKDLNWRRPVFISIILITIFLGFFIKDVSFEDDLNKINYFPKELQKAEEVITHSTSKEKSVFVVTRGSSLQNALDKNAWVTQKLDSLKSSGEANSIVSLNHIFPSTNEQQQRSHNWNSRIEAGKNDPLIHNFKQELSRVGMKEQSFSRFFDLLQRQYKDSLQIPPSFMHQQIFNNFVSLNGDEAEVINIVNTFPDKVGEVQAALKHTDAIVVDKTLMARGLIDVVRDNFNLILIITTSLVFFTLLINYGRIEMALMTFLPMVISWFWILGICGLFDIRFNFINVLITTFIFGLGDDFCIFVTDGLLSKYKLGQNKLASYRSSILLSSTTTIIGTGVLLFTRHPALQSIALLSVVGMICISFISLTLQPIIFHFAVEKRKEKGLAPLTLFIIITSIISFGYFAIGCIIVTALIPFFFLLPVSRKAKKRAFNFLISKFSWSVIYLMMNVKKQIINTGNEDFKKPAIIVANHQSFVDILALQMLHPRILILTNKWVWNSPLFGWAVRFAGFPTATDELENNESLIEKRLKEGYSIAIFPEGTRSIDGKIKRFHKGAFYLAEKYQLDILPILLHGFNYTIRKADYTLLSGHLTIKILPRIKPGDSDFDTGYKARTKAISTYMRHEFSLLQQQEENTEYHHDAVLANYIYKGPVLEWYVRIKMRLENNFEKIHQYTPDKGLIYDIGCGYGYLSYMLYLTRPARNIVGIDYDPYKIAVAREGYVMNPHLKFETRNLSEYLPPEADCFILKDVLHYLKVERQMLLLQHCAQHLSPGGRILIRDGFEDAKSHKRTKLTELFSTRLFGFNKVETSLTFLQEKDLKNWADSSGLEMRRIDENKNTSNRTYVFYK